MKFNLPTNNKVIGIVRFQDVANGRSADPIPPSLGGGDSLDFTPKFDQFFLNQFVKSLAQASGSAKAKIVSSLITTGPQAAQFILNQLQKAGVDTSGAQALLNKANAIIAQLGPEAAAAAWAELDKKVNGYLPEWQKFLEAQGYDISGMGEFEVMPNWLLDP